MCLECLDQKVQARCHSQLSSFLYLFSCWLTFASFLPLVSFLHQSISPSSFLFHVSHSSLISSSSLSIPLHPFTCTTRHAGDRGPSKGCLPALCPCRPAQQGPRLVVLHKEKEHFIRPLLPQVIFMPTSVEVQHSGTLHHQPYHSLTSCQDRVFLQKLHPVPTNPGTRQSLWSLVFVPNKVEQDQQLCLQQGFYRYTERR